MDNLLKFIVIVLLSLLFIRFCNGGKFIESNHLSIFLLLLIQNMY
ncbi:hypothetical protein RDI58_017897 [Solanum bulbocastanum]|uniref:Uncharacterized protein n=1 Tax=Solanum bulbocastanum TaxID=147425 RepID=A0AAN8TFW1_SOLBU